MNVIAYKFGIDPEIIYSDSVSYINNKNFFSNFSNQNPLDFINNSIDKYSFLKNKAIITVHSIISIIFD